MESGSGTHPATRDVLRILAVGGVVGLAWGGDPAEATAAPGWHGYAISKHLEVIRPSRFGAA
jgi:hypothetical protein